MTNKNEITDTQIDELRAESAAAGDAEQVTLCDRALAGDDDARSECAEAISAAAMDDSE